jgi:hypothetical protein
MARDLADAHREIRILKRENLRLRRKLDVRAQEPAEPPRRGEGRR